MITTNTTPDHLRALALRALSDALADPSNLPLFVAFEAGGVAVSVWVRRSAPASPFFDLTPCQRDLMAVLSAADRRLSTMRIIGVLEARGMIHGESTIKHALAALVNAGYLTSQKKAPAGYAVAERATEKRAA